MTSWVKREKVQIQQAKQPELDLRLWGGTQIKMDWDWL